MTFRVHYTQKLSNGDVAVCQELVVAPTPAEAGKYIQSTADGVRVKKIKLAEKAFQK